MPTHQVNCITISDDGAFVASGQKTFMGFPADAIIWDFATRKPLHKLSLHKVGRPILSGEQRPHLDGDDSVIRFHSAVFAR